MNTRHSITYMYACIDQSRTKVPTSIPRNNSFREYYSMRDTLSALTQFHIPKKVFDKFHSIHVRYGGPLVYLFLDNAFAVA